MFIYIYTYPNTVHFLLLFWAHTIPFALEDLLLFLIRLPQDRVGPGGVNDLRLLVTDSHGSSNVLVQKKNPTGAFPGALPGASPSYHPCLYGIENAFSMK